jgi:DNA-directed RNA polymerase specialized sigma24 family protein
MSLDGSITIWIDQIKQGNPTAAGVLWKRCYPPLSAMDSFCRAAERGRFPELSGRDGLWRLLFRITARKAVDLRRSEGAQRRGAGRVQDEAAFDFDEPDERALAAVAGDVPPPVFVAMMAEQCQRLLGGLPADLQSLAVAKMEGCDNEEIARQNDCSARTIERRVRLIRSKWKAHCLPMGGNEALAFRRHLQAHCARTILELPYPGWGVSCGYVEQQDR